MYKLHGIVLSFLLLASTASHAAWTEPATIYFLKADNSGIYLKLKGFENTDAEVSCTTSNFYLPEKTDELKNYQAKVSLLLSAYMSHTPVTLSYYGCHKEHIWLGTVALVNGG